MKPTIEKQQGKARPAVPGGFARRPLTSGGSRALSIPEQQARARWKPPVAAVIANALTFNRELLERLRAGMYAPDRVHGEQYQVIVDGLFATTKEQIAALEMFARVDWE